MRTVKSFLSLIICLLGINSFSMDTLLIPQTSESIILDGIADEAMWQNLDSTFVTKLIEGVIDDPDDLTASFKSCWDENNLYFAFRITDQSLNNYEADPWLNDCIALYFDMNNSRNVFEPGGDPYAYDHDDYQIRFVWDNGDITGIQAPGGIDFAHHTNGAGDGYQLEILIPWHELGIPASGIGVKFGFDLSVTDNDGAGREARIMWHSETGENWRSPSENGIALLAGADGELPEIGTAFVLYNGYFHPSGNYFYMGRIATSPDILPHEFQVINIGQQDLTGLSLSVTGDKYSGSLAGGTTLSPGDTTYFNVDVDASETGVFIGQIELTSNDPASPYHYDMEYEVDESKMLHVSTTGSDETGDGSELNPYRNIQHAVNQAVTGDTILVLPGTYYEFVQINDKELVLTSEYMFTSLFSSIQNTVIQDEADEAVVGIYNGGNTEIVGLTLNSGTHALAIDNSSPMIRNNILKESAWSGISVSGGSNPRIHNNLIIHNSHDGISFSGSNGEVVNNTFYSNAHGLQGWESGAIACRDGSDPMIKNNIMMRNNSFGVYVTDGNPDVSYNDVYEFNEGPYDNCSSTGGEMELHPLFYNTAHEDFKLQIGSPCIDAGDPDPLYNDPDGTRNASGNSGR